MYTGVIRFDGKRTFDEFSRTAMITLLMGDYAQIVQGNRLAGVGLQYLLIEALGLQQTTSGMMLPSEVYGLLDRELLRNAI